MRNYLNFIKNIKKATLTAVKPPSRFGALEINENNLVSKFKEKPLGKDAWINGGFFVLEPKALDDISGDNTVWEREPLEKLSKVRNCGL